jgi:glutathione reductase (NADPH)
MSDPTDDIDQSALPAAYQLREAAASANAGRPFDADLVVIGGGSGGIRAARIAASHGAKVILAEADRLGGTCVIRGCVPKKLLVYGSRYSEVFDKAAELGWRLSLPHFDWPSLIAAKNHEISRLEGLYARGQEAACVNVVKSRAVLEDAQTVRLLADGRTVRAKRILIATGGKPELAAFDGLEHAIVSDDVFELPELPKRLVIGGAGYIAIEFAGLFAALGSQVTIICRGTQVLRGFDEDLRAAVAVSCSDRGIGLMLGDSIERISPRPEPNVRGKPTDSGRFDVETALGGRLTADQVLLAYGRNPNTEGLGLDRVGVKTDANGSIVVNEDAQSNIASIYAIGDVSNRVNLTPVAIREGHAFADSVFGNKPWRVDSTNVPTAVFSTPEVGTVGLTELDARFKFPEVDIYKIRSPVPRARTGHVGETRFLKVIVDAATDRILGVHVFADKASEMAQGFAIAVNCEAKIGDLQAVAAALPLFGDELITMEEPVLRYRR